MGIFNHEVEILYTRLHELYPVVDRFFIFESNLTFTGIPKPLIYQANRHVYKEFSDKIVTFQISLPVCNNANAFDCEAKTRLYAYTLSVASLIARDIKNDVVLFSDVDEIPRREVVADLKSQKTM